MEHTHNLKSLTMDELAGVINQYPWFGAARRELCERMSKLGGSEWGREQYADAAMYMASRTIVFDIVRSSRREDYSDKDVEALLKEYITDGTPASVSPVPEPVEGPALPHVQGPDDAVTPSPDRGGRPPVYRRTVKVVGGDFFSTEQYDSVRQADDNFFARFKVGRSDDKDERKWEDPELGFCTETLAWVYADHGYFAEAKKIYSRLMLRYPEKSAYFASLIEKLDKEN